MQHTPGASSLGGLPLILRHRNLFHSLSSRASSARDVSFSKITIGRRALSSSTALLWAACLAAASLLLLLFLLLQNPPPPFFLLRQFPPPPFLLFLLLLQAPPPPGAALRLPRPRPFVVLGCARACCFWKLKGSIWLRRN